MGTKINSNYSDLITFTRASKGHALRPVSYGDELSEGSDFSSWDNNSTFPFDTFTAGSSSLTVANSTGKTSVATHPDSISLVSGRLYVVDVEFSITSGTFDFSIREQATATVIAEGEDVGAGQTQQRITFVSDVTADVVIQLTSRSGTANVTINNVSVKEVTFDQPDGTLTLFEHPNNIPRVEYDADGNRLGLLVEEARTNLITYSTMKDANYTKTRAEITDNQITSPDGTQNASKVNETTGASGPHYIYRQDVSYTSGNDYTFSVFAKADTATVVQLIGTSTVFGSAVYANFDIENGTIGSQGASVVDSSIQDVGNGWYRLSVTGTATATVASTSSLIVGFTNNNTAATRSPSYVGDTAQQFYVFGGQAEQGSFPTSYIKSNSGSTTTRSADVASIPVADFGFNTDVSTVVVEGNTTDGVVANQTSFLSVSDGTANNRFAVRAAYAQSWHTSGTSNGNVDYPNVGEDVSKIGYTLSSASQAASKDGATVIEDTTLTMPTGLTTLYLGSYYNGAAYKVNGHIKSIKYYPRRLTNAQLQELTS